MRFNSTWIKAGGIFLFVLIFCITGRLALAKSKGQERLDLGTRLYQEGQYAGAKEAFIEATELDPGLLKAWENLGWAYQRSGETDKAIEVWETVLKIDPKSLEIQNAVALLLAEQKRLERAIEHYESSLQLDPGQINIRLRLAKLQARMGQYQKAETQFKNILKLRPEDPLVLVKLANTYEESGKRAEAISLLKDFLSSIRPQYVLNLGAFDSRLIASNQKQSLEYRHPDIFNAFPLKIHRMPGGGKRKNYIVWNPRDLKNKWNPSGFVSVCVPCSWIVF